MSWSCVRNPHAQPIDRWSITSEKDGRARHLLELPSGDFINARLVDMVRCAGEKPDRSGVINVAVHIECKGSWFTVRFNEVDEARSFARAIVNHRDGWHDY